MITAIHMMESAFKQAVHGVADQGSRKSEGNRRIIYKVLDVFVINIS